MSIIIKLQGLPLEANSIDVRLYFLGLTIPDGGVHIIGGDEGTVFIEFASDEDARQAMARGVGTIKNSNVKLLLSSRNEMQSVIDTIHQKHRQYIQQQQQQESQQQQNQQPQQPFQQQQQQQQPMLLPQMAQQPWCPVPQPQPVPLLPWAQQNPQPPPLTQASLLHPNQTLNPHDQQQHLLLSQQQLLQPQQVLLQQQQQQPLPPSPQQQQYNNQGNNNRARGASGMRGGDDKLFLDKRCVLAASNIPYRATSKDIIDFLNDFGINEECIRRRYNQKGQPTADAKIAFPTPEAAIKAMKMMNKKSLCGRPVFFKPV